MSELIDNQSIRQEKLKDLIKRLHRGEDRIEIEAEFKKDFAYVTGAEIAQMEYNLVQDGVSIEEIQSLCDVHASLFSGSVQELHSDRLTVNPLHIFEEENREYSAMIEEALKFKQYQHNRLDTAKDAVIEMLAGFKTVVSHYAKKENILFPYLEKNGIETIPQVMWGVDNNIRSAIKAAEEALNTSSDVDYILRMFYEMVDMVKEMITKEDKILFPLLREKLTEEDFKQIGLILSNPDAASYVEKTDETETKASDNIQGNIPMSMGVLSAVQANAIFNTVPFDMTFVDADNKVKFVTQGKDRIFDRPASVIGRPVHLCHPPQSVHVVMKIVDQLRSGEKDHEDFWINLRGKMVHIRYYAVRDEKGTFLGTLEVTQDIGEIRALEGEKRLMSE